RGARHRLLPRWLSPRTGFPADEPRRSFTRLAHLSTVKHAPCRPVFLPGRPGTQSRPGADWQFRARAPPLASVFQACPSGKAPSMSEVDSMYETEMETNVKGRRNKTDELCGPGDCYPAPNRFGDKRAPVEGSGARFRWQATAR